MREYEALCTVQTLPLNDGQFTCTGFTQRLNADYERGATFLLRNLTPPDVPGQERHDLFLGMEALQPQGVLQKFMVSDISPSETFHRFVHPNCSFFNVSNV